MLYAESSFGMQQLLKAVEWFFFDRGMSLNLAKCVSVSLEASGKAKKIDVVHESVFSVVGQMILSVGPCDYLKYLG